MKCFRCDGCGMMVFFKNDRCLKCGHALGFLPGILDLCVLETAQNNLFQAKRPPESGKLYRRCRNGEEHQVCNWMVPQDDPNPFCVACRLNEVIPDLKSPKNLERWSKLELAKRRCVYTLLRLGLPLEASTGSNEFPLRFRFLEDTPVAPVLTGHQNGAITVNVAEADDDEREHRRLVLHEPYRTLVGHLRHETGHFYWDRLIANSPHLAKFRELFGDETTDYDAALRKNYAAGPPTDWQEHSVTAYGSSHPWEDWAETWAHYLHIIDTMETAANFGLSVNVDNADSISAHDRLTVSYSNQMEFESLIATWIPLTCALNSINRGMGLSDLYPFVISPDVIEKLRFIHEVIHSVRRTQPEAIQPVPTRAS